MGENLTQNNISVEAGNSERSKAEREGKEKGVNRGYRLYTTIRLGNSYIVVGAEVKNAGRDMEVNSISTVFGRSRKGDLEEEIYRSKEITPEQASLLNGRTSHQYPTEQEFSEGESSNNSETAKGNGEKDEGDVRNSVRVVETPEGRSLVGVHNISV